MYSMDIEDNPIFPSPKQINQMLKTSNPITVNKFLCNTTNLLLESYRNDKGTYPIIFNFDC